ncbi:meiosis initiator protein isoform X1 [Lissotriton helveticus]
MWVPDGDASEEHDGSSDVQNHRLSVAPRKREKHNNETTTLRELGQLLPSPLQTDSKKPTKKEILLRVLCYIEYLQRSIHDARALLQMKHRGDKGKRRGERRCEEALCMKKVAHYMELETTTYNKGPNVSPPCTPPRIKKAGMLGVCKKPRKNKHPQKIDKKGMPKKSRRCLCLEKRKLHESRSSRTLCLQGNGVGESKIAVPSSRSTTVMIDAQCPRITLLDCFPESHSLSRFSLLDSAVEHEITLSLTLPETILEPCSSPEVMESQVSEGITLLEMAEPDTFFCTTGNCTKLFQNGSQEEDTCSACDDCGSQLLLLRHEEAESQALVCYHSSEEEPDSSPWLPTQSPIFGSRGVSLICSPGKRGWNGSCWLSRDLGLSPSLFTSPGRLLPGQALMEGTENLSQDLFEDVRLSPQSPRSFLLQNLPGTFKTEVSGHMVPGTPRRSLDLFQSSFSLDHCYLSVSETSKTDSSPSSSVTGLVSAWNRQLLKQDYVHGCASVSTLGGLSKSRSETRRSCGQVPRYSKDCLKSSSDENGDCTWTPCLKGKRSHIGERKRKRSHSFQRLKALKKHHCVFQLKKKCVNGFIMFCRMNRKQYIRICPGTASTTATKELAHLWRVMSKQERRPYCIKARRFSRLHNRIMKQSCASSEEEEEVTPKPLHLLLAEKTMYSPDFLHFKTSPVYHQHRSFLN